MFFTILTFIFYRTYYIVTIEMLSCNMYYFVTQCAPKARFDIFLCLNFESSILCVEIKKDRMRAYGPKTESQINAWPYTYSDYIKLAAPTRQSFMAAFLMSIFVFPHFWLLLFLKQEKSPGR